MSVQVLNLQKRSIRNLTIPRTFLEFNRSGMTWKQIPLLIKLSLDLVAFCRIVLCGGDATIGGSYDLCQREGPEIFIR